jgi:photosystem II stability/assembly factor-like uncharacterized protein
MRKLLTCGMVAVAMAACTSTPVSVKTSQMMPSPSVAGSTLPTVSAPETPLSLSAIQRLDVNVGYIASWTGGGPVLARSIDGGSTWQTIQVPAAHLTALRFIDSKVGWVAGLIPRNVPQVACEQAPPTPSNPCYGAVLRTLDGGASWQKVLLIPYDGVHSEPVLQIQAIDDQIAWALVQICTPQMTNCMATVERTTDGGHHWTNTASGNIVAIRYATPPRGWMAMRNPDGTFDIKLTSDGGTTWATQLRTTSGSVVGLDAADANAAWVLTQDGGYCTSSTCDKYELLRTTDGGRSWTSLGNPKTTAAGNCWGGQLVGPLFASMTGGWLAENTGAGGAAASTGFLETEDGGKTWRCLNQLTQTMVVSAADPMHVWVASRTQHGDANAVFATDDGGTSWRQLSLAVLGGAAPVHQ